MEAVKFTGIGTCLYTRARLHAPLVFIKKFPSPIIKLISTRKKLIVKLVDGQIRYLKKTKKGFRLFSYNK